METQKDQNQREFWSGKFGDEYINRNKTIEEVNQEYKYQTGTTVEEIFHDFFNNLDRKSKILEL